MSAQAPHAWIERLRQEVGNTSQRRVAELLRNGAGSGSGYPSETLISQVLAGKYPGRTDKLQRLVEGYYLGATVQCPVLGSISRHTCVHHQSRSFDATNYLRIQLYRACRDCPNATPQEPAHV